MSTTENGSPLMREGYVTDMSRRNYQEIDAEALLREVKKQQEK